MGDLDDTKKFLDQLRSNVPVLPEVRSAKEVIDQAIAENQIPAYILYGFAIIFVLVGVFVVVWGVLKGITLSTLVGLISSSLFWPAMHSARQTRKENIAIRLLEAPLSRVDTAKEAAEMLRGLVNEILSDRKPAGKQK